MALSRLLLLCMVASEVWDAETKPIDFVCNRAARRVLNIVAEMESALSPISPSLTCLSGYCHLFSMSLPWQSDCNAVMTLSTPVQLPCTELHVASWENKSYQERRGDIIASLRLLIEGVKVMRALSTPGCGTSLLQRLENNINNYLVILTHLQLSGPVETPSLSCVPLRSQSLSTVLLRYNQLISGKLEKFMINMEDRCPHK
ncbi:thrombopoietin isoform X1 [Hippoglossus stenolepis]|uniref:thrombopoietin isoform X1 n=1 Tax=Hippoglossus stenolepis TaxID=195615 RepID=UPI00159CB395|nr:thrombopoietin isoform X1 [Hippoglossus stenolepis]